jgi:hypothetical protein
MRVVVPIVLAVATMAALLTTPIAAEFGLRPFACDLGPSPDWLVTILNVRHLVSFGILSCLAFIAFRDQPLWVPLLFAVAVTGLVEIEEGIFRSGHCRARDMIPDLIAIALGWAGAAMIMRRALRKPSSARKPGNGEG